MSEITVLVVAPDEAVREETATVLDGALPDVTVVQAGSLAGAETCLEEREIDVVVTAHDLGDGTGLALAAHVRSLVPDVGCVLYTDETDVDTESFEDVIVEYVQRGDVDQLVAAVEATGESRSQAAYPLPDDEADRLAAVEQYITDDEALVGPLSRITDLAADHFGVEVSSLNILREHTQEFLAVHGREWAPVARDGSICTYTILEDETMVVEDTEVDPRFAGDEALEAAGIRAYLGANLETPEGHVVGVLCVYDDEPRSFSAADEAYLAMLADVAVDLLVFYHRGHEGREAA